MENQTEVNPVNILEYVLIDLAHNQLEPLKTALEEIHPAELAHILESLPPHERVQVWKLIDPLVHPDVLTYLHDEVRLSIIGEMSDDDLLAAANEMAPEDLVEVLETLPVEVGDSIIDQLEHDHRKRTEMVLSFIDGSAGRLMNTDIISVRDDISVAVVLRYLRMHPDLPTHTDALMVVNDENYYLGKLFMSHILTAPPETLVSELMYANLDKIPSSTSEREVLLQFERRDLTSVAVVDENNLLLGRITIDNIIDLIREEAEHAVLKAAGLDQEEDLFSPMIPSAKRRGVWLGINLITVFMAAWVIGQFEEVLSKFVALAVLMPVVASMGGIAGSQTLTLTIRGLALDQIASSNVQWLTRKELGVGALNGLVWSGVVALVSFIWFDDIGIALILAFAMMLNLLAAAISGISIPLILKRMGIDPALSGAVILTTVTDIIGFLSFLGLASFFLL
ncbi:MAG: magnesium transporter [Gammaproteobacteria bacterium]|nr:magnesium transporter [Gammaproteobacteria bacterium]